MKSEDKIDNLIDNLEFKIIEAKKVREVFPDTIVRVVDQVGIRYQSPTLNGCADKTEFGWTFPDFMVRPYTSLEFEYQGLIRTVLVHTEPFEVAVASKLLNQINPLNYTDILEKMTFSKNIVRQVDLEIADSILHKNWKVDRNLLSSKVKTFLLLS